MWGKNNTVTKDHALLVMEKEKKATNVGFKPMLIEFMKVFKRSYDFDLNPNGT
jgi:hypothetical protein